MHWSWDAIVCKHHFMTVRHNYVYVFFHGTWDRLHNNPFPSFLWFFHKFTSMMHQCLSVQCNDRHSSVTTSPHVYLRNRTTIYIQLAVSKLQTKQCTTLLSFGPSRHRRRRIECIQRGGIRWKIVWIRNHPCIAVLLLLCRIDWNHPYNR